MLYWRSLVPLSFALWARQQQAAGARHHQRTLIAAAIALLLSSGARAQQDQEPPPIEAENIGFNYAYSAVLGAGYYSTPSGRVLVGTLPLSWSPRPINERHQLKLLFPVTGGIADVFNDEGELEIKAQLLTFTFLPGIAWEYHALKNWVLVPAVQAGFARDFELDTNAWLYSLSLRSYAWWDIGKNRLGLGNRLLGAGQQAEGSDNNTGFMLLESGIEWDYIVPWRLYGFPLSAGVYFMWQHYADSARLDAFAGDGANLINHYRVGVTFGFRDPVTIFRFIPLHRVGIAIGRGNTLGGTEIKSITLNLGFPLSYD